MKLTRVRLLDFRNIASAEIDFCPGLNAIVGRNAQGKTSLLEAIFLAICGKSFRTVHLNHLIRQNCPYFVCEFYYEKREVEQRIRIAFDGAERRVSHNETPCLSMSAIIGSLQGVLMAPDHLDLVKGAPQVRRQYLDLQLAQSDSLYLHHLSRFQRAMRQRNALLKISSFASIGAWEAEMATSAAYIALCRHKLVKELLQQAQHHFSQLTRGDEELSLRYKTSCLAEEESACRAFYLERYQNDRLKEADQGSTASGPHKDDLTIGINGREARYFSSEGQARSCVAALKLAEWHTLKKRSELTPLFLVDDLAVSLDQERRNRFLEEMQSLDQVFITSTSPELPPFPSKPTRIFHMSEGSVSTG